MGFVGVPQNTDASPRTLVGVKDLGEARYLYGLYGEYISSSNAGERKGNMSSNKALLRIAEVLSPSTALGAPEGRRRV